MTSSDWRVIFDRPIISDIISFKYPPPLLSWFDITLFSKVISPFNSYTSSHDGNIIDPQWKAAHQLSSDGT
jgi:hypothetical protein